MLLTTLASAKRQRIVGKKDNTRGSSACIACELHSGIMSLLGETTLVFLEA